MHYMRQRRGQELDAPSRYNGEVKYQMAHLRVRKARGSARAYVCSCGDQAREWAYDGSDPAELTDVVDGRAVRYSADPKFYQPLCIRCHRNFDVQRHGRSRKECTLQGCAKPQHAKGLCNTHYLGQKRGWNPNYRLLGA
ncbi:hypothetical protein JOEDIRT_57 [Mycobacterium phage JoeDirt]|uniref:Uncharacterized protein n=2 Tax=Bronvirus TaxID=1623278 RepID=G1BQI6_9CAUD|nr:hypothetical protein FGG55_gp057 [Mycobacterium phage JoeDirt]AEK07094.1 hypothetical protein JOEDIRT_57 [Mycobacterium phage JoeDirt]AEK07592.1 hypothetical protein UPIE_58 [Mycobacterium phage UPIE]